MPWIRRAALALVGLAAASPVAAYTLFSEGPVTENRWPTPSFVPYVINQNGSDNVPFADARAAIVAGMNVWTLVPDSTLTFVDNGNTALGYNNFDSSNVVVFIEDNAWTFGTGIVAVSQTRWPNMGPGTDFYLEGDIALNGRDITFSVDGSTSNSFDIAAVIAHEAGHLAGLDHSPVRASSIYPFFHRVGRAGENGTRGRTLTNDDRAAVQYLYGTGVGTGSIAGTIDSDIDGQGAVVAAINLATGETITSLTGNRWNIANEAYSIDRLAPGNYVVITFPLDDVNFAGMLSVDLRTSFTNVDSTFRPRFYTDADPTGTPLRASATTVVVTAGATTSGIDIDPPDTVVSQNIYYSSAVPGTSSVQGPRLTSAAQSFGYGYSTVANQLGLLGPAGNTLTAGTFVGSFGTMATPNPAGIGGELVSAYSTVPNVTAGARGANLTLYSEHSGGTEVDFLPGSVELDFDPLGQPDTDGDLVVDDDESADQPQIVASSATNELMPDSDGDGLSDGLEALYATNPRSSDTDGDGTPDGVEARLGWDPLSAATPSPATDTDLDGLPDHIELRTLLTGGTATDPNLHDTDSDGFSDGYEVARGTNPLSAASYPSLGDADNSGGVVDAADVAAIAQWIAGNGGPLASYPNADVDGDGVVSASDVTRLANQVNGVTLVLR